MKSKNIAKSRNLMYTQQLKHLPTKTVDKLEDEIIKTLKPKKYAVIIHDKDIDENGNLEETHVHAMLTFNNARSCSNVAKLLQDKPQYVEMWTGNSNNGYAYLVHATKNAITKYQYDPNKVIANFDYISELQKITEEVNKSRHKLNIQILLDALYDGSVTKEDIESKLTGSQIAKYKRQIDDVWAKRLQRQAIEFTKKMIACGKQKQTIWIYGHSGTGKTRNAKEIARKKKDSYYISGSSRDVFQNYAGEHTLILDELRPKVIPYHDILRILDPFGEQIMAPSRYIDKTLACDLIIITSPYNPYDFYKIIFPSPEDRIIDSIEQLIRRLTLIIKMDFNSITAVEYDNFSTKFRPIPNTNKKNPYSGHISPPITSTTDLFNSLFD